jgi:uncharacterized C2H2 Zn-finger protein
MKRIYKCPHCDKTFDRRSRQESHITKCMSNICLLCNRKFKDISYLKIHLKAKTCTKINKCPQCHSTFTTKDDLRRHIQLTHNDRTYLCEVCGRRYKTLCGFQTHSLKYHYLPVNPNTIEIPEGFRREESSFNSYLSCYSHTSHHDQNDMREFFMQVRPNLRSLFSNAFDVIGQFKFLFALHVELEKVTPDENIIQNVAYFVTRPILFTTPLLTEEALAQAEAIMFQRLSEYQRDGSNWVVTKVKQLDVHIGIYRPLRGGQNITLDKYLTKKGGLINVQSTDNRCFLYSVLAGLHRDLKNPTDYKSYAPHLNEIVWEEYPMSLTDIPRFERQNNVRVHVYGYENAIVFPLKISEFASEREVFLLLLNDQHYCCISDFNKLLGRTNTRNAFCKYCCLNFWEKSKLVEHETECREFNCQRIKMPKENEKMYFKNVRNQLESAYTVYSDFECLLNPIQTTKPDPLTSYTHPTQQHEPSGFAYVCVTPNGGGRRP